MTSNNREKVTFGAKPVSQPQEMADTCVETRDVVEIAPGEPTKRLTLDLPESLHRRIKVTCASKGVKMVDAIRTLLEEQFPK